MADQHEPLGKAFAGSLFVHLGVVAAAMAYGVWQAKDNWGSEHASGGSVGVNMVSTIPIPRHEGELNPLANDSKSVVPQAPEPVKAQQQVKAPEPDAVAIDRRNKKKHSPKQQSMMVYRPPIAYKENQVYSNSPQALSSPLYGTKGSNGIDIGPASVLGSRFGGYVDEMRQEIANRWVTADVRATPSQKVGVIFTIARDGSVSGVHVSKASGNYLLDTSATRAILDAN